MGLFSQLARKDPLHEQAVKLVPAANIMAVSSFVPLLDQYPLLRAAKVEAWDLFATSGAIFVAINDLKGAVPPERFMSIYSVLLPYMRTWHERSEDAVLDCQKFVARTTASGTSPQDALGFWVLWKALGREPAESEATVGRAIGTFLSAPLQDWWSK